MNGKTIDLITKIIALFTSLLVFLGIISSVVYYSAFKINILENITIGEALLLFMSKFSTLTLCFLSGYLISVLFSDMNSEKSLEKLNKEDLLQKINLNTKQKLLIPFIVIPLLLISLFGFSPFYIWTLPVSLITRLFLLLYVLKRIRLILLYRGIESKIADYIQMVGILIVIVVSVAMTEAYLEYTWGHEKSITLRNKDGQVIKSDSSTLYLGKSQSYYYLYNRDNKKAILIKADQIESLEIE
jgi:transcriptional antiterminator Rof (Rho-off)